MNSINLVFFLIWGLAGVFFFFAFLIIWHKRRYELQPYFSYGLLTGGILFGMQLLSIFLDIDLKSLSLAKVFGIIIRLLIDSFKMMIFTTVGIDYATKLAYPLYIKTHFSTRKVKDHLLKLSQLIIPTLAVTAFCILYSIILFKFTNPELASSMRKLFESDMTRENYSAANFVFFLVAAFSEEITYRLGIQNYLAIHLNWRHSRYWLAILVTSILWTIIHTDTLHPNWVKFAQIFPIGLLLGWLFRKYGIISCILAHGLFNVIIPLLLVIENYTIDTIVFNY
ncbi:MAG: CPBP family intramembrane metalloprotease [Okeania sp. SIO2F4]|uniref:CPBP family intramembrane glutamic endopeptidase n=1 Tax=Okeania sp. SIO2F4 TaxID=2607790 RepID=UPI0014293596|nr:CPBP family intramembrane glutamic endopeptidase [Okeania sp. SIO2F4]NES04029.1 CPBP family intramembrane metalloprotease [Okeania sp. SIO2F4]